MSKFNIVLCLLTFVLLPQLHAQQPYVEKGFLILQSTKDYQSALKTANEAGTQLGVKVDLRGYYAADGNGLKTDEQCGCGQIHPYVARGRWDDGEYISIEHSDQYDEFTNGYYIVVMASGEKGSELLSTALTKAKKIYGDAYVKNSSVYIGCMH